ncbi:MerR family transcriptional regulator [Propionigenium maris DSM 9537]|uniref:MerR family transcriptional regulator n=1 Tax=Propionigenium maris DSM 9537 TaxID=1123000 RepID=A0A9W6LPA2_9FUSO|nr:MerR family transcriptional regulator [Propionigenium maris]GLI58171.1 MerR family transcriptional regulator [Propionigenium maris DSM 9537]
MKKKYKITEVAKIFDISRQTLIYYDKIGLFKPKYIDEENSYRYYVEEQFFQLRFIMVLKRAGFSLSEIKDYTKTRSPEESLEYLEEKERSVTEKIIALEASRDMIRAKISEARNITLEEGGKMEFIELQGKRAFMVDLGETFSFEEYDRAFHYLDDMMKRLGVDENEYVEEITKDCVEEKDYMGIKNLGFFIPDNFEKIEGERRIGGGTYATFLHRDLWMNIGESYEKMVDFLEGEGYEMVGDPIEVFKSVSVHLGKGEVTRVRIYIPVKKTE